MWIYFSMVMSLKTIFVKISFWKLSTRYQEIIHFSLGLIEMTRKNVLYDTHPGICQEVWNEFGVFPWGLIWAWEVFNWEALILLLFLENMQFMDHFDCLFSHIYSFAVGLLFFICLPLGSYPLKIKVNYFIQSLWRSLQVLSGTGLEKWNLHFPLK